MKDFAKSYEQRSWEYAANTHARMRAWLKMTTNPSMIEYAQKNISEMEQKYPQLKNKDFNNEA